MEMEKKSSDLIYLALNVPWDDLPFSVEGVYSEELSDMEYFVEACLHDDINGE